MLISGSLSFFFSPASLPLIRYPFNNSARSPGRWMSRPRRSLCAHTRLRLPLWINYGGRSKEHATTKPVMQRVVRVQKCASYLDSVEIFVKGKYVSRRVYAFHPREFFFFSFVVPQALLCLLLGLWAFIWDYIL